MAKRLSASMAMEAIVAVGVAYREGLSLGEVNGWLPGTDANNLRRSIVERILGVCDDYTARAPQVVQTNEQKARADNVDNGHTR